MKTILLTLALVGALDPHDFYVSILTIRHNPATKTMDLTWRMTAHDVEHALVHAAALKLGGTNEHQRADSMLNAYFHEHLSMQASGRTLEWNWLGKELDGETLYCYLQVNNVDSLNQLTVANTLLQDLFYEQQNLVHVERDGAAPMSHTFIFGAVAHTFSW